jgi:hypothetical protein
MSLTIFEKLLIDLGEALSTPLHLDEHNTCAILINEVFRVQLELDKSEEFVIMGGMIASLPPGSYRISTLKEALKSNDKENIKRGILSYIPSNQNLFIHKKCPIVGLSAEDLLEKLVHLCEKGMEWKTAIESGKTAPSPTIQDLPTTPSNFQKGIKT